MTVTLQPENDCALCPRLVAFRTQNQAKFPQFHNAPVQSFGDLDARLLIVGLAPGLKGANQTGRPFTGDYAGDLLYATLLEFGFAEGIYGARPDDGLRLLDCRVTNAVRCVPPENKPVGAEVAACRPFLQSEIADMPTCASSSPWAFSPTLRFWPGSRCEKALTRSPMVLPMKLRRAGASCHSPTAIIARATTPIPDA